MLKNKKVMHWKFVISIEIIIGILILISSLIYASNADMKKAESQLLSTVSYMKKQCNDSEIRDMASEAKSLLRVTESVEQIRWRLENEKQNEQMNNSLLETYARDSYLDGLLLLDKDGNIKAQFDQSGLGSENVLSKVELDTLLDTMYFSEKTYAIRLELDDESHIDLASVNRLDEDGIVVGYFYTSSEYARLVNNSIRAIVSGFDPQTNGTIVISKGNQIVISNDKSLEGTKVNDTEILKKIMKNGTGKKLVYARDKYSSVGNHFGLMENSKDYYIYAFMDERNVFKTTFPNVLSLMFVYILLIAIVDMVLRRVDLLYQKDQLASQKEYTDKLEKALVQAKKANVAKNNFLSRMSHDIRTPLNGIIGLIKIDEEHFDDQNLIKENHKKMQVSANHLLSLINDVLQMSKLEDGNTILTNEVIDLVDLTQNIVDIIIGRANDAGIVWEYERGKKEIPYPYIYGSPIHLRQIFLNIYGNCIKYNRPGGKITTIVDTLDEHDGIGTYRWTISDTGIGMSQEFLAHIFEPFVQEKSDARSVYNGTGLGMAIVKGLIDQMGGTIEVKSEKDVGSTFIITIPFKIASMPVSISNEQDECSIQGLNIMLVEDNELNAEIAAILLRDQGAKVTMVANGKEAVELFESKPEGTFDVILMDIMMPIMNGIEATKTIRNLKRKDAQKIPIIAMTANAFKSDVEKCIAAGMNEHVAKPFDIDTLKKIICKQLKK